jgi:hypothetical protein
VYLLAGLCVGSIMERIWGRMGEFVRAQAGQGLKKRGIDRQSWQEAFLGLISSIHTDRLLAAAAASYSEIDLDLRACTKISVSCVNHWAVGLENWRTPMSRIQSGLGDNTAKISSVENLGCRNVVYTETIMLVHCSPTSKYPVICHC